MSASNMQAADDAYTTEIKAAAETLARLRREQHALRISACGVAIGQVVRLTQAGAQKGQDAIVRHIHLPPSERLGTKPWLMVSVRKANGEFGAKALHVFDWWEPID